jgi:hypothetical protein
LTLDQVMAAQYHLEQRDRKALLADLAMIQSYYLTSSGLPTDRITLNPDGSSTQSDTLSVASTLAWLRLMAESYSFTGDQEILRQLATRPTLFSTGSCADGTLPADTQVNLLAEQPRQDPAATPTIRPSITPTLHVAEMRQVIGWPISTCSRSGR